MSLHKNKIKERQLPRTNVKWYCNCVFCQIYSAVAFFPAKYHKYRIQKLEGKSYTNLQFNNNMQMRENGKKIYVMLPNDLDNRLEYLQIFI